MSFSSSVHFFKMNRYKLSISYNGAKYCGFQIQNNADTIQSRIEIALKIIFKTEIKIFGSGRTDTGVHSLSQIIHFDIEKKLEPIKLIRALNSNLPADIRANNAELVDESFHCRYSAKEKTYKYYIYTDEILPPFYNSLVYHNSRLLDVDKMKESAEIMVGEYDCVCYMSKGTDIKNTVRKVMLLDIKSYDKYLEIIITANGFLYNMARTIVGTLIEVGVGKKNINDVEQLIKSKNRNLAGFTAPPQGLYLFDVKY